MNMIGIDYEKRVYGLDMLRFFAIVTVLYNHGFVYARQFVDAKVYNCFHFDGVSLFFVLSGFLIGGILFKTIEKNGTTWSSLKEFWIRRWFRTFPMYYLVLLFLSIQLIFRTHSIESLFDIGKFFFFFQNVFSYREAFFGESWSLAVEEWFYLTVPVLLWGISRIFKLNFKNTIVLIILFFVVACPVLRYWKLQLSIENDLATIALNRLEDRFPFTVLCRLDSLMYGIIAAYLLRYKKITWDRYKNFFLIAGVLIIGVDYYYSTLFSPGTIISDIIRSFKYRHVVHYSVLPFGIMLVIPYFNAIRTGKGVVFKSVIFISIISYSLYLVHLSVVKNLGLPGHIASLCGLSGGMAALVSYLLYWLISIGIAMLTYTFYEKPMTNLRDRIKI